MIQTCLNDPAKWLRTQTPKEYVQMIAAASEALRKVKPVVAGAKGRTESKTDLLADFRKIMNGHVEN